MIKCIIFDCDGTLVDSEELFNRALSIKLGERGVKLSVKQLVDQFRGVQLTTVLETLQTQYNVELDDAFIANYRVLVNEFFKNELKACNGVEETLAQIEVPMCVATNGPLDKMKLALNTTHLEPHFNGRLFSAFEVDSWKPEPDLFLHAAQKMGYKPEQCMVVEDSIVGIEAAIAAQMSPILYDPHRVHGSAYGVQKITHFSELLTLL